MSNSLRPHGLQHTRLPCPSPTQTHVTESVMPSNHPILCHHWVSKHPRHILIKLTKIKHKEQILKAARKKQQITQTGILIRVTANLSIETLQARREWQDILGDEREKPTTQITIHSKDLIQILRRNQKLYRQAKAERIQHHQTSSSTNAKGSSLDRKHRKGL